MPADEQLYIFWGDLIFYARRIPPGVAADVLYENINFLTGEEWFFRINVSDILPVNISVNSS